MKGQRLFVRETTADDEEALRDFYRGESFEPGFDLDRKGVIAKLVGDPVAHMTWERDGKRMVITHLWVAAAVRRKRVGLGLLQDAAAIARLAGAEQLAVSGSCAAREFFLRTGFAEVAGELLREVS